MKIDREKVLAKYGNKCAYCGNDITLKSMQVDHFIPQRLAEEGKVCWDDVTDIKNLMPACRRCNHYKRAHNLETFRAYLLDMERKVLDTYLGKIAVDYGMVEWRGWDGKFYFERQQDYIEPEDVWLHFADEIVKGEQT